MKQADQKGADILQVHLYEEASIVKFVESESRMVGASGLAGVMERHCFNGVNVWYFAKWKKSGDELWWSLQSVNRVWFFVTPWTAACQASLSITNSQSLFKLMSISLVMPSYHLILCHPLLLLPSIFPSIRVFPLSQPFTSGGRSFGVSALAPSNKYEGLDLLAIQGILKNLLQHHNPKAFILWCSSFFMIQFSHPYMTSGKTIALTIQIFVSKVMSLLFNMLSRFIIAFLPRNKHLLISWLQSLSAMILETKSLQSATLSTFFPICHGVIGPDVMNLVFWKLGFKPAFSLSSFTLVKRLFISSLLSAIRVVSSAYLRLLLFLPAILIPAWHFPWCTV